LRWNKYHQDFTESKKFDSLAELRNHLESVYQEEKMVANVSHLTFGEDFDPYELGEADLEVWNLAQDYFGNVISFDELMGVFRAYQLSLFNENFMASSRGKFSSYLSNMITKRHLEESRPPNR